MDINIGLSVTATGTVDAITCVASPAPTSLTDKLKYFVKALGANTSTTPTFAPNGLTARTIVKKGGQALVAGDIYGAGAIIILQYDLANTRWELLNPVFTDGLDTYLVQSGSNLLVKSGKYFQSQAFTNGWIYSDANEGSIGFDDGVDINSFTAKSGRVYIEQGAVKILDANSAGVVLFHGTLLQLDAPTYRLQQGTASKMLRLDANKNIVASAYDETAFALKANNLSDLSNAATARTNLGGVITCAESLDFSHNSLNPADSTSYFFAANAATASIGTNVLRRKPVSMTGKVYHVGLQITISTSVGTNEAATMKLNNVTQGTSVTLFTNLQYTAVGQAYTLTLPTPFDVTFGDLLEIQVDMPAFATNPVAVIHYLNVIILSK